MGRSLYATLTVTLLLALAPAVYGTLVNHPDLTYNGAVTFQPDHELYAGWIARAAAGHVPFNNPFVTTGENPPVFLHPLWTIAGFAARLTGASPWTVLLLIHAIAGLLLGYALHETIRSGRFWTGRSLLPTLFCFTAGGMGVFLLLARSPVVTPDLYFPVVPLNMASGVPHIGISLGLMLLAARTYLFTPTHTPRSAATLSLLLTLSVLIRPYDGLVVCSVLAPHALIFRRRDLHLLLPAAIPPLASFGYVAWLTGASPGFGTWAAQPFYPSPPFFVLPLTLGIPGLLAVAAGAESVVSRRRVATRTFYLGWILAAGTYFMSYGLFHFSWMFHTSLLAPTALLAVDRINSAGKGRTAILLVLLILCSGSSVVFWGSSLAAMHRGDPTSFQPASITRGMTWLANHAEPGSVVMARIGYGTRVLSAGPFQSVCGHKDLIPDLRARQAECRRFFMGRRLKERLDVLKLHGVDYVFYGPLDRREGVPSPRTLPFLRAVFIDGPVEIYRVLGI